MLARSLRVSVDKRDEKLLFPFVSGGGHGSVQGSGGEGGGGC